MEKLKLFMTKNNYLATKITAGVVALFMIIILIVIVAGNSDNKDDVKGKSVAKQTSTTEKTTKQDDSKKGTNKTDSSKKETDDETTSIDGETKESEEETTSPMATDGNEDTTTNQVASNGNTTTTKGNNSSTEENTQGSSNSQTVGIQPTTQPTTPKVTTTQPTTTKQQVTTTQQPTTTEEPTTAPPRGANGVILEELTIHYIVNKADYTIPATQSQIFEDNNLSQGDFFGPNSRFVNKYYTQDVFANGVLLYSESTGESGSTVDDIVSIYGEPKYQYQNDSGIECLLYKYLNTDYGENENVFIRFEISPSYGLGSVLVANMQAYENVGDFSP